jgi:hypothetical protein
MKYSSQFWLRSAGFPFEWLEELALSKSKDLLDQWIQQLHQIKRNEELVRSGLSEVFGGLVPEKLERTLCQDKTIGLTDLKGNIPNNTLMSSLLERDSLLANKNLLGHKLARAFSDEVQTIRDKLFMRLSDSLIQEAIFLSNPESLERIRSLLSKGASQQLNARTRQHLRLAWNYIQRLCAKNDTASFYGPMAWGRFDKDSRPSLQFGTKSSSDDWINCRAVFFEYWVIARLSEVISKDPEVRQYLPIRLNPGCDIVDRTLSFPINRTVRLSKQTAYLVCEIASAGFGGITVESLLKIVRNSSLSPGQISSAIEPLIAKGVIERQLEIPLGVHQPEEVLRQKLQNLPDQCLAKDFWLAAIDHLCEMRDNYQVADLPTRQAILVSARDQLLKMSVDITRDSGKMYVGRSFFYEDCERNIFVEIGGDLSHEIEASLKPVSDLFTSVATAVASILSQYYLEIFTELGGTDTNSVDFIAFYSRAQKANLIEKVINDVRPLLRGAWQAILAERFEDEEIALSKADLDHIVEQFTVFGADAFKTTTLGVKIQSPDIMIAAPNMDAINDGSYWIVLGEVHPGVHTVSQPVAQPFCPNVSGIKSEVKAILSPGRLILADNQLTYQRSNIDWLDCQYLSQLVLPGTIGRCSEERLIPSGRCRIIQVSKKLVLEDRKTGKTEDLVTVIPGDFHRILFDLAGDILGSGLSARLVYRKIILKRKTWCVDTSGIPDVNNPGEEWIAFAALRQWANAMGLPRWVFVKSPSETKPIYVDFDNPLAVDLFLKIARQTGSVSVSEMRPSPNELWLKESRGRFCSEIRTSTIFTE